MSHIFLPYHPIIIPCYTFILFLWDTTIYLSPHKSNIWKCVLFQCFGKHFKKKLCRNSIKCWTLPWLDQTLSTSPTTSPLFWKSANSEQNKFANRYITNILQIFSSHWDIFYKHIFQKPWLEICSSITVDIWSSWDFCCLQILTIHTIYKTYLPSSRIWNPGLCCFPDFWMFGPLILDVLSYLGCLALISQWPVSPDMD